MQAPLELKKTLNLPKTDFSMKANLPQNEPKWLERWEGLGLYAKIRESRKGKPSYILHDGPPYANGAIHEGHALNKCLKDFVVKSKTMAGFDSPYIPGWDCHGLPIEIKVDEKLGRKKLEIPAIAVRRECRSYADKYLNIQRDQFRRLGILGRWDQPYSTMTPQYESVIVRQLFDFMENGAVYKGLRPVYWCIHDKTALAEAEIEYADHTSPSVWVKYRLTSDPEKIDPKLAGKNVSTIIWTTTPWTLPASMAVAFHPDLEYVALEHGDDVFIVADALAGATKDAVKLHAHKIAHFPGRKLEYATFVHPFLDRQILGVLADYVTTEQGTGAVHTAPSHGADDFYTGTKYKLDQRTNVDEAGHIRNGLPEYDGKRVFDANQPIIELLKSRGALMAESKIEHSYPHCWRCHNPVIFRATEQWFISMEAPVDGTTLRQRSLDEIKKVKWIPAWGEERISNMIAERPDWCISRQRVWGVPIAVFFCEGCGKLLDTKEAHKVVVDLFASQGADAWYTLDPANILPAGTTCPGCSGGKFRKETDIIDVWFESGSSHAAVLGQEPGLTWPADLYLEGGDQYRGWFHSSLLVAVGTRGHAPYRGVATNGWTLDPQGRATSKSLGNGIDPIAIAKKLGGEIIRLWVASVDFQEDVTISEELLEQQIAENYRKVRNTFRYVLSNLPDFDPEKHAVAFDDLYPLDKYWLMRTAQVSDQARKWYESFEFHRIYHQLNDFMVDLSREYIDVVKDRLYTAAPNSRARRAAQTGLWRIGEALVRLAAPILSFTADEVWASMPRVSGRPESVHLAYFPKADEITGPIADPARANALWKDFETLMKVRDTALKALEIARQEKKIGSALEASVTIVAPEELAPLLEKYRDDLRFMLIVSKLEVSRGSGGNGNAPLHVLIEKAPGQKCERCWNYSERVGEDSRYPSVCERCSGSLKEIEREIP